MEVVGVNNCDPHSYASFMKKPIGAFVSDWSSCCVQVFLEPLGQVVGSRQSKLLLLKACLMEPSLLAPRELARLGCMLGVEEWTRPLLESFSFPPDCVHSVESATSMPGFTDKLLGDGDDGGDEEGKVGWFFSFYHLQFTEFRMVVYV